MNNEIPAVDRCSIAQAVGFPGARFAEGTRSVRIMARHTVTEHLFVAWVHSVIAGDAASGATTRSLTLHGMTLYLRLLGPLVVCDEHMSCKVGGVKERTLLVYSRSIPPRSCPSTRSPTPCGERNRHLPVAKGIPVPVPSTL